MATETESWECVEESTPRSESEDSCGIIVSDSASRSMSRLGSRGSNGRARGSHPDRLYVSMAQRMQQRKQRRQELEMRYECARKQQEEEKRVKEELKLTLEKLQRKAVAEQNRAAHRRQKQVPLEVQVIRLHHSVRKRSTATAGASPLSARTGRLAQLAKESSALWVEALAPLSASMQEKRRDC